MGDDFDWDQLLDEDVPFALRGNAHMILTAARQEPADLTHLRKLNERLERGIGRMEDIENA